MKKVVKILLGTAGVCSCLGYGFLLGGISGAGYAMGCYASFGDVVAKRQMRVLSRTPDKSFPVYLVYAMAQKAFENCEKES